MAQNNGLERTSAVYGKRASVRSPLNPVFCAQRGACRAEANDAIALALHPRKCVAERTPASWLLVECRASRLLQQQVGQ